ncbi:hypothetical protein FGRMN_3488 [Fusarium graminum]|nr:hypothetical protein FGRMN_3488 [Fusarium graminum]
MSTNLVSIDPEGDVLIILPVAGSVSLFKSDDTPVSPTEKRFKCSKKHLTFASPRAAKIFSSSFKEASKEDDGFHHWKFDATLDSKAFELVLKIIHGKTSEVPRHIDQNLLTAVASIVDDLQCHDALNFFGNGWISSLYGLFRPALPKEMNRSLVQYILISSVFEHASLFEASTEAAIRYNNGTVRTFELPIRIDIPSKIKPGRGRFRLIRAGDIEKNRLAVLTNLVNSLTTLQERLLLGLLGCSQGCTSMLLGALLQGMKAAGLYPPPQPSMPSTATLDFVINALRQTKSPIYFAPQELSVPGKYSGSWVLSARSNTPRPPAGSKAPSSGGLFGNQSPPPVNAPTSKPAVGLFGIQPPPPVTALPVKPPGGLFGDMPARATSTPPANGGLFGSASPGATLFSPAVADGESDPPHLVRHNCTLKDFLHPILDVAEAEIKGLKLASYSRPHVSPRHESELPTPS